MRTDGGKSAMKEGRRVVKARGVKAPATLKGQIARPERNSTRIERRSEVGGKT